VPACGDLMMSGRAALQLCFGLYLVDTMSLFVSDEKLKAVKFTVFVLIGLSSVHAILMKSEYTIGVAVSFAFVAVAARLYGMGQTMRDLAYGPFVTSALGEAFGWFEKEIEEILDDERIDG